MKVKLYLLSMMKVKLYLLSSRNLFFDLEKEIKKKKFLEDNKYNFTFIIASSIFEGWLQFVPWQWPLPALVCPHPGDPPHPRAGDPLWAGLLALGLPQAVRPGRLPPAAVRRGWQRVHGHHRLQHVRAHRTGRHQWRTAGEWLGLRR